MKSQICVSVFAGLLLAPAFAQTGDVQNNVNFVTGNEPAYTYQVNVVGLTTPAIDYRHRSGSTMVGFRGTEMDPDATGDAKINSHVGTLSVSADFNHLKPASTFGPEYLTYVLWAITPEGRPVNLGEVVLNGKHSSVNATTDLQAFGLIVTAEPYFAVTTPSNTVVLENRLLPDTVGVPEPINVRYQALNRGAYMYTAAVNPLTMQPVHIDPRQPFELYEARNAVRIAQMAGADKYASESFARAQQLLEQAEDSATRKKEQRKVVIDVARHTVEQAEDARVIAVRKEQEELQVKQREALEAKAAAARAEADMEAQQRAAAENAKIDADEARRRAEQERLQADQARQQAEAAQQAALQQQQALAAQAQQAQQLAEQARQQAALADQQRQQAVQQQQDLRSRLEQQLNQVLQTRDTARGLIVSMSDVLFDTGSATLRPGARERLAKVAGILLAYPDLKIQVEGHTDSTGTQSFNQKLSERRAETVREYLVAEGAKSDSITAQGFGQDVPIASNATSAGRQQNRRVDMVVSGQSIGQPTVAAAPAVGGSDTTSQVQDTTTTTTTTTTLPADSVSQPRQYSTPAATLPGNSQQAVPQVAPPR